jgi:3-oxoacyl-[acyl-carrier protein] reductase
MLDLKISGKTALITGCNNPHGTGAAIGRALAGQGVRVFLHYYRAPFEKETPASIGEEYYLAMQSRSAAPIVDEIAAQGGQAAALEGDLGEAEFIPRLFEAAEQAFGPVEILVNNAAHSIPDSLLPGRSPEKGDRGAGGLGLPQHTLTAESADRHYAVNSRGTALMMAEFARRHIERKAVWGRIVNVSSDGAAGFAGEVSYGASKYAIESLSRAAAKEFGPYGITVNIASFGPIQTGWISPELERVVTEHTPLGRPGEPEDVADAILLLVSEQARWLTGQLLYIGGGHRMV